MKNGVSIDVLGNLLTLLIDNIELMEVGRDLFHLFRDGALILFWVTK